ncbi:CHAT domain-containing protein [Porphyrobacter sp. YT40]|uniref:CHAT domain-containing protein n=1 Tax=Porphyrobacter sp. YT40 TaxID=2547601 RepID=UPI001143B267|nr:CHAT domain-containing protein [Porphyrobacter sp. YT40]QDH33055.1 CHAT domain-containing protein [Porphyrobacter sp. YT40]
MTAVGGTGNFLGTGALVLALSLSAAVPSATLAQAGAQADAQAPSRADAGAATLQLGRNANGDSCSASRNWTDPAHGRFFKYADIYSVTCSGAVTDTLARVRLFPSAAARSDASAGLQCGAGESVSLPGFASAVARRCFDPALGYTTVVIDADKRGSMVQISAAPNAVGAAYQAALLLTGQGAGEALTSNRNPVDLAALAPLPERVASRQIASGPREAAESLLARATSLNFRGLSADASRFLRNELSTLPADTSDKVRAQLLLEAGLADSNIRFFRSASLNIDAAEAVIRQLTPAEQRELRPQLETYRGLHALNQRDFGNARRILGTVAKEAEAQAQLEPAIFAQLNNPGTDKTDPRAAIAQPNLDLAREMVVGVQGKWALSFAQLALGNRADALTAIVDARKELGELQALLDAQRADKEGLYWLDAKLLRQLGRVQADSGDYGSAIKSYDDAIALLLPNGTDASFNPNDPAIAVLKLDRAAIINRAGQPAGAIDKAYSEALDAMLAAREEGGGFSTGLLHPYLDSLAGRMANGDKTAAARYFSALQVSGESSAARQVNELQQIVSADPEIAEKLRERDGLERRLAAIPVEIADARANPDPAAAASRIAALEAEQSAARQKFAVLDADLAVNGKLAQVFDRPAELTDLQARLKPGEAYVRLAVMNDRVFGILIDSDRAYAIRPRATSDALLRLTAKLRSSLAYDFETNRIPGFDLTASSLLYSELFGSVDNQIKRNTELVVDGGRLFSGISAAMLVTDDASEQRFRRQVDKSDYSQVAFLAKDVSTSVAMSPVSFIASRGFKPSAAPRPLLGLAAPVGLGDQKIGTDGRLTIGSCRVDAARFAGTINRLSPIAATEISEVSAALGLSGAPALVSGARFSDTELQRLGGEGGELANYQVLHFATHGVTEGLFDCDDFPAGLLTSFGGTGESDLLLSYAEIAGLRLNTNLVVMSACQTASQVGEGTQLRAGEARPGDTLDGLVRSFFAAGSRAVMATYWETSNAGQSEVFMSAFYEAARDRSIVLATNQAQRAMLNDPSTSHPFYWAGFFVVGQTNNQVLSGRAASVAVR